MKQNASLQLPEKGFHQPLTSVMTGLSVVTAISPIKTHFLVEFQSQLWGDVMMVGSSHPHRCKLPALQRPRNLSFTLEF